MAFQQTWPTKQLDGTVIERHVYSGPDGEGFIDRVWRDNGGTLELKETHTGPEPRQSHDFKPAPVAATENPIKLVLQDRSEWTKDKMKLKDAISVDMKGIDGSTTKSGVIKVPYTVNGKNYSQEFKLNDGENKLVLVVVHEEDGFKTEPQEFPFTVTYIAPKEKAANGVK